MRRIRRSSILALVVALALVGAACGDDDEDDAEAPAGELDGVKITFSTSLAQEEKAAVNEVIGQFEDATGADVTITEVTSQDLPQKLKVDVDSGRHTIHLFAQDNLALRSLVDDDLVEDLSDVEIPSQVIEELIPEQFNDKQYFLPYRPNVRVTYVNKARFDEAGVEAPTTIEEFESVARKLKDTAGGPKVTFSFAEGDPAAVAISEWIVSHGGDPVILNDEGSVGAFTHLQDMWRDGLFAEESLQAKFDTEVDYLQGETAWLAQNWPFTSAELAGQGLLENFRVYEGWAGPSRAAHVIGGEVLGIPKGVSGKQREAAVELALHLMSKEGQETLVAENAWPSVRTDALGQVPEEQQETFEAIQKALETGWFRPNVAYWSDVSDALNEAIDRIVVKGQEVKPVLDELNGKIVAAATAKGAEYPPS